MDRIPTRLLALNAFRWLKENLFLWTFLSVVYALSATLLLEPILSQVLKRPVPLPAVAVSLVLLLLVPAAVENLPLPSLSFQKRGIAFLPRGVFGGKRWAPLEGELVRLYLRHDLRRVSTWLGIVLTAGLLASLPKHLQPLSILLIQFPMQRALYSLQRWRPLALVSNAGQGARLLMLGLWLSQSLQLALVWIAAGLTGAYTLSSWLGWLFPSFAAIIAAGSVAYEGDSGRPWLVNFFSLAAGTLAGYVCAYHWSFGLIVGYLSFRMWAIVKERIRSVEHLDEDTLIP